MEFKKFENKYVIRLEKGEEIVSSLKNFCKEYGITLGMVNGIGAVEKVNIGFFDASSKGHSTQELYGGYEITALTGNITTMEGEPYLHLHVSLADSHFNLWGGHLNSGIISITCEIVVDAIYGTMERKFNNELGINLLDMES